MMKRIGLPLLMLLLPLAASAFENTSTDFCMVVNEYELDGRPVDGGNFQEFCMSDPVERPMVEYLAGVSWQEHKICLAEFEEFNASAEREAQALLQRREAVFEAATTADARDPNYSAAGSALYDPGQRIKFVIGIDYFRKDSFIDRSVRIEIRPGEELHLHDPWLISSIPINAPCDFSKAMDLLNSTLNETRIKIPQQRESEPEDLKLGLGNLPVKDGAIMLGGRTHYFLTSIIPTNSEVMDELESHESGYVYYCNFDVYEAEVNLYSKILAAGAEPAMARVAVVDRISCGERIPLEEYNYKHFKPYGDQLPPNVRP